MALRQLSEHIFMIPMATNVGVIALPEDDGTYKIFLVDSGNTDSDAEKILATVNENFPGSKISTILGTHGHADHCGGNSYITEKTGAEIWTSKIEGMLMEFTTVENSLFYGSTPPHEVKSKFLLAKPSKPSRVFEYEESFSIESKKLKLNVETISLPGHYFDQIGYLIHDSDGKKVMFAGDALSGRNVIKKYWIQYLLDEQKTKDSLMKLSKVKADFFIPSHGDYVTDIEGLAELNILALLETENLILSQIKTPKSTEQILKIVADINDIKLGIVQNVLIGSTIKSYLTSLYDSGKVSCEVIDNIMVWKAN